jgi:hypothetical protein
MLDDELRREILESQKAQESVAKWKVAMIAGLGAAGLGAASIGGMMTENARAFLLILWGLIPLVCVYADTVSYHVGIRIITIARYFRLRQTDLHYQKLVSGMDSVQFGSTRLFDHYEWYSEQNRKQFSWESKANLLVSVLLSLAITVVGVVFYLGKFDLIKSSDHTPVPLAVTRTVGLILSACGVFGLVGSRMTYRFHINRADWLDKEAWIEPKTGEPCYEPIQREEPQWPAPEAGWLVLQQATSAIQTQLTELTKAIEALRATAPEKPVVVGGTGGDVSPAGLLRTNADGKPVAVANPVTVPSEEQDGTFSGV